MVNYIHLINWFWDEVPYRTGYKSEYGSMFLAVVDSCNRNGWRATSVEYDRLQSKVRVGKRMYYEAIKWLQAENLMSYKAGRNEYAAAVFDLHEEVKAEVQKCTSTAPLQHLSDTSTTPQPTPLQHLYGTSTAPSIYKPLNSETNKPLNEEVGNDADASTPNPFDEESFSKPKKEKPSSSPVARPPSSPAKSAEGQPVDKPPKDHLFRDSPYYDLDTFKAAMLGTKYDIYDLEHYHEALKNWADSGSSAKYKKADWLATVRGFMSRDAGEGKAKLRSDLQPISGHATANLNRSNNNRPQRESDTEFADTIDTLARQRYGR